MGAKKVATISFGLNPRTILAYYFFVCTFSGNIIAASEPLKCLLRLRGIGSALEEMEQEKLLIDITAKGVTASIIGAIACGILNDYAGPKFTAVLGQACSVAGMVLMFFTPTDQVNLIGIGCQLLGCTYACVSISHTHVAALFRGSTTLAITALCVGNDLSLAVPNILTKLATNFFGLQGVIMGYMILNIATGIVELFLVPSIPFSIDSLPPSATVDESSALRQSEESASGALPKCAAEADETDMTKAPVYRQLCTMHYWCLTIFISFCFFRKVHYSQLVRLINEYAASASGAGQAAAVSATETFKNILPFTICGSLVTGAFTNQFGVYSGIFLVNTYGVLLFFFSSFPVIWTQYFAIIMYDLYAGFIFGLMYAYLGGMYGFATMGVLQAALKLVCGWSGNQIGRALVLYQKLPNILYSNMILCGIGVSMYALPVIMMWYPLGGFAMQRKRIAKAKLNSAKLVDYSVADRVRKSSCLGTEYSKEVYEKISMNSLHCKSEGQGNRALV